MTARAVALLGVVLGVGCRGAAHDGAADPADARVASTVAATVDAAGDVGSRAGPGRLAADPGAVVVDATAASPVVRDGPALDLSLPAENALDGARAAVFAGTPTRHVLGVGSRAAAFRPDATTAELEAALAEDAAVVVLRPGVYVGDLVIRGRDALIFGEGWAERAVTIDGSVHVEGDGVQLRGVTITGELAASGDDLGVSFSRIPGPASVTGAGCVFVRNTFCSTTVVPASEAILLDNLGVAPLLALPASACAV